MGLRPCCPPQAGELTVEDSKLPKINYNTDYCDEPTQRPNPSPRAQHRGTSRGATSATVSTGSTSFWKPWCMGNLFVLGLCTSLTHSETFFMRCASCKTGVVYIYIRSHSSSFPSIVKYSFAFFIVTCPALIYWNNFVHLAVILRRLYVLRQGGHSPSTLHIITSLHLHHHIIFHAMDHT